MRAPWTAISTDRWEMPVIVDLSSKGWRPWGAKKRTPVRLAVLGFRVDCYHWGARALDGLVGSEKRPQVRIGGEHYGGAFCSDIPADILVRGLEEAKLGSVAAVARVRCFCSLYLPAAIATFPSNLWRGNSVESRRGMRLLFSVHGRRATLVHPECFRKWNRENEPLCCHRFQRGRDGLGRSSLWNFLRVEQTRIYCGLTAALHQASGSRSCRQRLEAKR